MNKMPEERYVNRKRNIERKVRNIQRERKEVKSNKNGAGDETERRDEMKGGQKLFHLLFG